MLSPGVRLGRYEVLSPLGAGGMGEVYRARDTELDRKVALKVLPEDVASDPDRLKRFEREAKATAALSHPNVLTVFDVGREAGRAYLVCELLEGSTLGTRLARGRLPTPEALAYAVQIARGLAAAHAHGIVHRDLKPDNLFLTTSGVLKILDFGLARVRPAGERNTTASDVTGPGAVMGTVAYMSPEQAKGHPGDARSDIFALGTVLYEMLSGRHPFKRDSSAETLTAILRDEPPALKSLADEAPKAVQRLVRRCLEKKAEDRFQTANDLALALEAVGEAQEHEDRPAAEERPYPGLASFTEADAARFFGREAEIAALWEKIRRQKLLALIGPSGAGKTSFLRAGVFAQRPTGWVTVYVKPGAGPIGALARALTPQLTSDPEAMAELVQGATDLDPAAGDERLVSAVSRWRKGVSEVLLVVDPFEELFTLNPKETQSRFSGLLGRLAGEADVHVLLSLRDDFLFRCTEQPALGALLQDLTPLRPPSPAALHRALVEPAARLGVRFEEEALVGEMVATVGSDRGALPLLAFAASRLWEMRDRGRGLLTRQAYQEIGGVAGALAQHAEVTLQEIGPARAPVVREIFRNLITSQGTRVVREREELLSVFAGEERTAAEVVLGSLVDARLLTEFERPGEPGQGSHQEVEVIHESLLAHWPRLVRWQTQDADGAQLRDQLRQAAQLWQDRGKTEDLLWSGQAYRDFALWRERYPALLTAAEDAFTRAMGANATRRRRRRRAAVAALVGVAASVAIVTSVLWQRAATQVRQREAAELVSLGRLRLEGHPTAALAHAIASLERADNMPARHFAVEALWKGPMGFLLTDPIFLAPRWSPDGRWLAIGGAHGLVVLDQTGRRRHQLSSTAEGAVGFSADGTRLVTGMTGTLRLWSLPQAQLLQTWTLPERAVPVLLDRRVLTFAPVLNAPKGQFPWLVREISIDGGAERVLGRWQPDDLGDWAVDHAREWLMSLEGGRLLRRRLDALGDPPQVAGRHEGKAWVWAGASNGRVVTSDERGEIRLWDVGHSQVERTFKSSASAAWVVLDRTGHYLATTPGWALPSGAFNLFDLTAPRGADPQPLLNSDLDYFNAMDFHPRGEWLASGHSGAVVLWNLVGKHAIVLGGQKGSFLGVAFTPDGRLVSTSDEGAVRLWPLFTDRDAEVRELWSQRDAPNLGGWIDVDRAGQRAVVVQHFGTVKVIVLPLDGSPARVHALKPGQGGSFAGLQAFDPSGQQVAFSYAEFGHPEAGSIRVLDLATRTERQLRSKPDGGECKGQMARVNAEGGSPLWLPDGRLVSDGTTGLRLWDLTAGSSRQLRPCRSPEVWDYANYGATPDSRVVLGVQSPGTKSGQTSTFWAFDLTTGTERDITSHGNRVLALALDPSGATLVTGDADGLVRVGPLSGDGEPHLLYGHNRAVTSVAVSPDGKWIASGSDDGTIRLWPMPQGPPLQTLPCEALLEKLRALTNLRVVTDSGSATGYKIEPGPFPGWAKVPEW